MARPLKTIDWTTVEKLCAFQCTGNEIAAFIGMDYDTLNRACRREQKLRFTDYFAQKSAPGKVSLRRVQFQTATEDRNPTMLIWLGKQMLGQQDRQQFEHTGADKGPIQLEVADAAFSRIAGRLGGADPGAQGGTDSTD